jgi:hypothetical protein
MELFVVLTVAGNGHTGTFAGTSPPVRSRQEAFQWAWPLALQEVSPLGFDSATVVFFSAEPAEVGA